MRKLIWLLALPYVVQESSYVVLQMTDAGVVRKTYMEYRVGPVSTDSKEVAEDFAEALNEAHASRDKELK
jgi:hypothetical protein